MVTQSRRCSGLMGVLLLVVFLMMLVGMLSVTVVSSPAQTGPHQGVYDLDWQLRYYLMDNTLYSLGWQIEYYLKDDLVFDKGWIKKYYLRDGTLYDLDWHRRYYIREIKGPEKSGK